ALRDLLEDELGLRALLFVDLLADEADVAFLAVDRRGVGAVGAGGDHAGAAGAVEDRDERAVAAGAHDQPVAALLLVHDVRIFGRGQGQGRAEATARAEGGEAEDGNGGESAQGEHGERGERSTRRAARSSAKDHALGPPFRQPGWLQRPSVCRTRSKTLFAP